MRESSRLTAVQTPIIPVIADLIRSTPGVISLGQGVVNYAPPPIVAEAIGRFLADPNNHKYQGTSGIPSLLEAIAEKLDGENGVRVGAAHGNGVMVTAGGNQAFLNVVLAILDPGDEAILPVPYYFNHEMAVTMAGARPVLVPTDSNYQLDLDAIAAAVTPRTRAIVTISPNNPSGVVYPEESLRAVNALCARRGLFHVSDEAYEYFTYDGAKHFSPASIPGAEAHTISLYSMSKAYGFASWRIGWMAFPATLEPALRKIQDTVIICPTVVAQFAAAGAMSLGPSFVREKIQALAETRAMVRRELSALEAEGLAEVPRAEGAFYYLLRVNSPLAPLPYVTRLIREHKVAVIPGDAFGLEGGCSLRLAYGALQPATAVEGVGRFVAGVRALRG
ncbi:pyridoxal phosphate-dependent aminotransferase [Methylocystis sp. JAN1]|uniref:pyridoxal phosphate-dependent aminotransferase n=1 Tax=Methylocystis sp. JAN1 TaxID=3397211 RepID=UPI003FA1F1AB